jgi:hypothetical protein
MSFNRRDGAPYRARTALAALDQRGITLPAGVLETVNNLDRIEAELPPEPAVTAIHDAVLAGADRDQLDALVVYELGSHRIRTAYAQATLTAALGVLGAIMDSRDDLHAQLAELAENAITTLTRIADIGDVSLDVLIRGGRHDDARQVAERDIAGQELHALYEFRDLYLTPGGPAAMRLGTVDASRWRDPEAVDHKLHGDSVTARYLAGLRGGGTLWYPTVEEAVEAARPLYDMLTRDAKEAAARQRQVGGFAAFAG